MKFISKFLFILFTVLIGVGLGFVIWEAPISWDTSWKVFATFLIFIFILLILYPLFKKEEFASSEGIVKKKI